MTELGALSGDVADLLDYRLDEHGMHPALWFPPVGRACIVITCQAPGLASLPAKFGPAIDEIEPDPAPSCGTCGSTDPETIEGLPYCPNEYHYPAQPAAWRRITGYAIAVLICAAWLLSLFLYAAGVIK